MEGGECFAEPQAQAKRPEPGLAESQMSLQVQRELHPHTRRLVLWIRTWSRTRLTCGGLAPQWHFGCKHLEQHEP